MTENLIEETVELVATELEEVVSEKEEKEVESKEELDSLSQKIYGMLNIFYGQGLTEENLDNILEVVSKDNSTLKLVYGGGIFYDNMECHIYMFAWVDEQGEIKTLNARIERF